MEVREGTEIARYTEIETGKRSDRPELAKAIQHAKMANATLIVAKLDRLARSVAFTSALMESRVDFVCCDCPTADKFHIHILAAVAEHEARMISERTRKALGRRKGSRCGARLEEARPLARQGPMAGRRRKPRRWRRASRGPAKPTRTCCRPSNRCGMRGRTIGEIAGWLNAQGFLTSAKGPFTVPAVWRILKRYFCAS